MSEKSDLRRELKAIRDSIPKSEQKLAAEHILRNLKELPEFKSGQMIGLYISKDAEVDTYPILEELYALKKTVIIPKVNIQNDLLEFYEIKSGLKDCHVGHYNVYEPNDACVKVDSGAIDVLLVPGIAFDRSGQRLGYGKGFYDRFLNRTSSLFTVGLSYEKTFLGSIPRDSHDVPVRVVLTEKGAYRI